MLRIGDMLASHSAALVARAHVRSRSIYERLNDDLLLLGEQPVVKQAVMVRAQNRNVDGSHGAPLASGNKMGPFHVAVITTDLASLRACQQVSTFDFGTVPYRFGCATLFLPVRLIADLVTKCTPRSAVSIWGALVANLTTVSAVLQRALGQPLVQTLRRAELLVRVPIGGHELGSAATAVARHNRATRLGPQIPRIASAVAEHLTFVGARRNEDAVAVQAVLRQRASPDVASNSRAVAVPLQKIGMSRQHPLAASTAAKREFHRNGFHHGNITSHADKHARLAWISPGHVLCLSTGVSCRV